MVCPHFGGYHARSYLINERNGAPSKKRSAALGMGYWPTFQKGLRNKRFITKLQSRFDQTEFLFRRIEALRVSLAKHEIPKSKGMLAVAPGYGRINMTNGSIYWQIVLEGNQVDLISRRAIADECCELVADNSRLILPVEIQKKVASFPREAYGITRVGLILKSGLKYPSVIVAWNKQVIAIPGFDRKLFDVRKVVDICKAEAPPEPDPVTVLDL